MSLSSNQLSNTSWMFMKATIFFLQKSSIFCDMNISCRWWFLMRIWTWKYFFWMFWKRVKKLPWTEWPIRHIWHINWAENYSNWSGHMVDTRLFKIKCFSQSVSPTKLLNVQFSLQNASEKFPSQKTSNHQKRSVTITKQF